MPENYVYEKLTDANLTDFAELYKAVYDYKPSLDEIKNKFSALTNTIGCIGYIAYSEKRVPAAFYGVFPRTIATASARIICAQSGSTMTHPNHRNQGLFKKLARLTYDECKQLKVSLVYGIPNEFSFKGFQSLGWTFLYNMIAVTIPLPTVNFFRYLRANKNNEFFLPPKIIEKFYLFKLLPPELEGLALKPGSVGSVQVITRNSIKLKIKITQWNQWKIGEINIPPQTTRLTCYTTFFLLLLEMIIHNASLMSYFSQPHDTSLKRFFPVFLYRQSLKFGFLAVSENLNSQVIENLSIKYKDYDTF